MSAPSYRVGAVDVKGVMQQWAREAHEGAESEEANGAARMRARRHIMASQRLGKAIDARRGPSRAQRMKLNEQAKKEAAARKDPGELIRNLGLTKDPEVVALVNDAMRTGEIADKQSMQRKIEAAIAKEMGVATPARARLPPAMRG